MKLVVMCWLERKSVEIFIRSNVAYRPDLASKPLATVCAELAAIGPDVIVAHAAQAPVLMALQQVLPQCRFVACGLASAPLDATQLPSRCTLVTATHWAQAEYEAFVQAESMCRPQPGVQPNRAPRASGEVMLAGAGVVNLVTALVLQMRGHRVSVYDRMSDPLRSADTPQAAGATFGGRDARIFSLNESRHHLACVPAHTEESHTRFHQSVAEGGWLSRTPQSLGPDDRDWIRQLEAVPPWAALEYNNDIIGFNRRSHAQWQALFSLHPELLQGAHHIGRLLRVYPTDASWRAARQSEAEIGALIETLGPDELVAHEPVFANAIEIGAVAGALRVQGFSLNVQAFSRNLIRLLQAQGARFQWQAPVSEIRYGTGGEVAGLLVDGTLRRADHYVVCPGAYARSIKGRGEAFAAIGAMVGMWVTIPNDGEPLSSPLKVRRRAFGAKEAAQGANVIPAFDAQGRPVLHCSAGHGFVGASPDDVSAANLPELERCVMDTAEDLFRDKLERARRAGLVSHRPHYCIRPWTPSGLGILDTQPTEAGGQLVISGGHNTGGFAQSPQVGEAVACALEARPHAMHTLYHPRRFSAVFEEAVA